MSAVMKGSSLLKLILQKDLQDWL